MSKIGRRKLLVGDIVRSIQIGRKKAFEGIVREVFSGHVHVEHNGRLWHRTGNELQLVRAANATDAIAAE